MMPATSAASASAQSQPRLALNLPPRGSDQVTYTGQASYCAPLSTPMGGVQMPTLPASYCGPALSTVAGVQMPVVPVGLAPGSSPTASVCTPMNVASTAWRTKVCPLAPCRLRRAASDAGTPVSSGSSTGLVTPANLWPTPSGGSTPASATYAPQNPQPEVLLRSVSGSSSGSWQISPTAGSFPGAAPALVRSASTPSAAPTRSANGMFLSPAPLNTIADVSMNSDDLMTPSPVKVNPDMPEPASISPITPPKKQERLRHALSGEKIAFHLS